ncbi:MAG: flagellar biosynthesis anti-sigma factor FlgM [Firmicutes bacterium]|nr:flagellar biosynthesis anti-sigma factor FlgM [Bacillota bacterium]
MECHHLESLLKKTETENGDKLEEIKEYKKKLKGMSNIRWEKVAKIKKAVNNGEYHVDSTRLARSILKNLEQNE